MGIIDFAREYVAANRTRRRNPVYTAARFCRLCGDRLIEDLTAADIESYRSACEGRALSPNTIESSVGDLIRMHHAATGVRLSRGRRLKERRPMPDPASLDAIAAVYVESPAWLQQYLALQFWTCLRVADVLRFQLSGPDASSDVIRWTASKTGHPMVFPVPVWLRRHLAMPVVIPPGQPDNHLQRVLRRELRAAAKSAGVPSFKPQQVRQRGLSEWSRVNAMAGQLVHGSGLGILDHYVDPLTVLEAAGPAVRLPAGFATEDELPDFAALQNIVGRLDPEAQALLLATATRLAR